MHRTALVVLLSWMLLACNAGSSSTPVAGDPDWKPVGAPLNETDGVNPTSISLAFDAQGVPYVALADSTPGYPAFAAVFRLESGAWTELGAPFRHEQGAGQGVYGVELALDGSGNPHVLFSDDHVDPQTQVTTFHSYVEDWDGTTWTEQGPLSPASHLKIATDGAMYVAEGATVYRRDPVTGAWAQLGGDAVSGGTTPSSLALGSFGDPWVAAEYRPATGAHTQIKLAHWNGSSWDEVGGAFDISGQQTRDPHLVIDGDGNPVLAYVIDQTTAGGQVGASRWTGTRWQALGEPLSRLGSARNVRVASDSDGSIWLAFEDGSVPDLQLFVRHFSGSGWSATGDAVNTPLGALFTMDPIHMDLAVRSGSPMVAASRVTTGSGTSAPVSVYVQKY